MSEVKFCKDCAWSAPDKNSSWSLRCKNPKVNAKDSWALSCVDMNASCTAERDIKWFAACGMSGKQWEEKK